MTIIDTHFNLIIEKYKLSKHYKLFMFGSYASTIFRESITWCLLYFSIHLKKNPNYLNMYTITIFILIILCIILYKLCIYFQSKLTKAIRISNHKYYIDKLLNSSKSVILNTDMVHYYNLIYNMNKEYEYYINNIKVKNDLPIIYITLIVRAINNDYSLMITLAIVYYIYIEYINRKKISSEKILLNTGDMYELNTEHYFTNSKSLILNNEFNNKYYVNQINESENHLYSVSKLDQNIFLKSNICMVIILFILIYYRYDKLDQFTFLYYFMLYYDIEYITSRQNEYHKHRTNYNKLSQRIIVLNSITDDINNSLVIEETLHLPIKNIIINKIENRVPVLFLRNSIIINENDHILVSGISGSGKSSLLYLLKGIIKVDTIDISPSIEKIYEQTYINIPNYKGVYSGLLYDIISNYNKNPDIELINNVLLLSKFKANINLNVLIDVNKISAGELMRLVVARILYSVKSNKKYNILLFDEIDSGLNDNLSIEVCNNLRNLFTDKIILYITHNEHVKLLFNKVITANNGIIN